MWYLPAYFIATNGVKRLSPESPVPFCLYSDGSLVVLSKAWIGCYIGITLYKFWLMLMTQFCLQCQLQLCTKGLLHANEHCISSNAIKSKCLAMQPNSQHLLHGYLKTCTFYVGDKSVKVVDSLLHLGYLTTSKLIYSDDIVKQHSNLTGQVITILCYFR